VSQLWAFTKINMADYGIPYMGSKESIADLICSRLPSAENFYDLFGGGFSITDCMLQNYLRKYKSFHFNELEKDTVELIKKAIAGDFNYKVFKPEFIDRETFLKNKDKCAYTRICWSFGNNQKNYLFGKDIEQDKKSLHNAVVFNKFDKRAKEILGINSFLESLNIRKRRLICRRRIVAQRKRGDLQQLERLQQLQQLQQLERLERLERLQRLQRLQRLEFTSQSYDKLKIKPDSVIYCDPPYVGTAQYTQGSFDHKKFYKWALDQKNPVFISEFYMPERFEILFSVSKNSTLSGQGSTQQSSEKVFVNPAAKKILQAKGVKTFKNAPYTASVKTKGVKND